MLVEIPLGRSELDEYGWGADFSEIKAVIDQLDHQDLNELEVMGGLPPSAENVAEVIYWEVCNAINKMPSVVSVSEGKGNSVRFTRALDETEVSDPRRKLESVFG